MNKLADTATRALEATLDPLEQRLAAAHELWASGRDPDHVQRYESLVALLLRYFAPDVRHVEHVPKTGPALVVGNHSGYVYMPDAWAIGLALARHRGLDAPAFGLAYDLLFTIPGVGPFLRRSGALPASGRAAEAALGAGGAVIVYPGGDWENCRPRGDRNRVDFHGRMGFVRLALRTGVPVVPVVSHGAHHTVVVVSRGDRLAKALHLDRVRVNVLPWFLGPPVLSMILPPPPLPAKVTVEFLEALDWSGAGSEAADDPEVVRSRYDEITALLQSGLDRLAAERPHPVLSRLGLAR